MTDEPEGGDPGENDEAAGDDPSDEQDSDIVDSQRAEQELSVATTKKRIYDLLRETLPSDPRNYAIAPILDQSIQAVFRGEGVGTDGGTPGAVGHFLVSLQGLLNSLDARVLMTVLDFASSVVVELEPDVPASAREMAKDLAELDPEGPLHRSELGLIPTSVVAAHAAVRLLDAGTPRETLTAARRYGVGVTSAYVALARTVATSEGEVTLQAEGRPLAVLRADRAERVVAEAKKPEPLEPTEFTIVGRLTRTDSEVEWFRVVLDRDRLPAELDARKRVVEGPYTEQARQQVEANGLWNQRVIARIRGFPMRSATRASPGFSRFEFLNVRRSAA